MNLEDHMVHERFNLIKVQCIGVEPKVDTKRYFVEKQGLGHHKGLLSIVFGHFGWLDYYG